MSRGGAASPALVPTRWPLVGRHEELDSFADALADEAIRGVLIYGPAGVGKTRLADECMELTVHSGRVGGRAAASAAATGLSLGALIPLLPVEVVDRRFDPVALYTTVVEAFRARAGEDPFVLLVDDLHRLDASSATLLGQLVDANAIFLLGTVRTGEQATDAVTELWRRDHVLRVDLDDLPRDAVDTLLHLALGGPVEGATVEAVARVTQGNVLFVREIVLGARAGGRLVDTEGVWRLTGPLLHTARLAELVDARLAAVPGAANDLLSLLALMEPIGLGDLEDSMGLGALEMLDNVGLLTVRADGRRQEASLAHPLYAEVLRERMSALTRRRLLLAHLERVIGHGARRREDALRMANARLDAEGSADPELLVTAARLARYGHDHDQVVRLARAALAEQPVPEAKLLLAESLHELGAYEDAELLLSATGAASPTAEDDLGVLLLEMRARNLFWGLQRLDDAIALYRSAREEIESATVREELVIDEGMALAMTGRPVEALALIADIPGSTPRARVLRGLVEVPALVLTGKCVVAGRIARRTYVEHEELGDHAAVAHPGLHMIHLMMALLDAGRFEEASALGQAAYRVAIGVGAPAGQVWWSYGIGRAALMSGRVQSALRWLGEAAGLSHGRFHGQHRIVLSLLATCRAQLGDTAGARAAVDEIDSLPPFAYRAGEQEIGRAWAAVSVGDLDGARSVLLSAARDMAATGQAAQEAWLLHEVARLGHASAVRERLDQLGEICEGDLVAAYAAHARAAASRSARGLSAATDGFATLGARLMAAEAAAEAADAYRRDGDGRTSTAMAARASALRSECEGARTPALMTTADAPEPLTAREREIATLAAQRLASKEIAQRLHLSVRTVDNHLQRIYTKLGVSGRSELAEALGMGDPA